MCPAVSKSQQKLFGLAQAVQQGKVPASKVSGAAKSIAKNVKKGEVKKFASTPTKGLPDKVKKEIKEAISELIMEMIPEAAAPIDFGRMLTGARDSQNKAKLAKLISKWISAEAGSAEKKSLQKEIDALTKKMNNESVTPKLTEARSIGAIKIKKLKAVTTAMWKSNHNVTDDQIIKKIPIDWWDTWESADSEIRDIIDDTLMELVHSESKTPQLDRLQESLGRQLSVPEKHQLAIAYKTMKMHPAMLGVMGGMTQEQAKDIIKKLTGKVYKEVVESANEVTHAEFAKKAKVATPCTAYDATFGGKCLNCGYDPRKGYPHLFGSKGGTKNESSGAEPNKFEVERGTPVKEALYINPSLGWLGKLNKKNWYRVGPVTIMLAHDKSRGILGISAGMITNPTHKAEDAPRFIEAALDSITGLKDTIFSLDKIAPHKDKRTSNGVQKLWLLPVDKIEGQNEGTVKLPVVKKSLTPEGLSASDAADAVKNAPEEWWRDAFHSRKGKITAKEVERMKKIHRNLDKAFKELSDHKQFGGAYIKKMKNGDYIWPEQYSAFGGTVSQK